MAGVGGVPTAVGAEIPEALLEAVRLSMRGMRAPTPADAVRKDECAMSHDTPDAAPEGLAVNLRSFVAYGGRFVGKDAEESGNGLYLRVRRYTVPPPKEEEKKEEPKALTVDPAKDTPTTVERHALLVLPANVEIALPNDNLPTLVTDVCTAVINHAGQAKQESLQAWSEDMDIKPSKYADDLVQEPSNDRLIPPDPKLWKCMESGATENLWLNLSDGFIGSGRRNWDGSGGNGAALRHYEAQKAAGKHYPLAVKLGTITPHGADVFSYAPDENDLVEDPKLKEHLAHWGIDIMTAVKTDKTMAELTIDLNATFEFDRITEAGKDLEMVRGPGKVGLGNIGNSCYIASVLQLLASIDEVASPQLAIVDGLRSTANDGCADTLLLFAKAMDALRGTRYADANALTVEGAPEPLRISPRLLRAHFGRGHPEFSSVRQQDAWEYIGHLVERIEAAEREGAGRLEAAGAAAVGWRPLRSLFEFELEERLYDPESKTVRYTRTPETILGLNVPLDRATNSSEVAASASEAAKRRKLEEAGASAYVASDGSATDATIAAPPAPTGDTEMAVEKVVPRVPLMACVEALTSPEVVEGFASPALDGALVNAQKRTSFATFPPYLLVQIRRYYLDDHWRPSKLDAEIDAPAELNLERFRGHGMDEHEVAMPDPPPGSGGGGPAAPAASRFSPDADIVAQIVQMGFDENGAKKACKATNNAGAEAAMEWVLSHMGDADFNEPYQEESAPAAAAAAATPASGGGGGFSPDADIVAQIVQMGFDENGAKKACKATNNAGAEAAMEWVLSHMGDADFNEPYQEESAPAAAAGAAAATTAPAPRDDGLGVYELIGFVSHIGANTACGHYVCHARRTASPPSDASGGGELGPWVLYNDEKVALSQATPVDRGYLYLYRRKS